MITLKSTPLKRWYRVKDNIIYDILTKEPNKDIVTDAIPWYINHGSQTSFIESASVLPRITFKYGYVNEDDNSYTNINYKEYFYLDSLIEVGDKYLSDGKKFVPYINNNELPQSSYNKSYGQIFIETIKDDIYTKVINEVSKDKINDIIPFYLKDNKKSVEGFENEVYFIEPKTVIVNGVSKTVNCVFVEYENVVFYGSSESYTMPDTLYPIKYNELIQTCVNKYCKNIANKLCTKQELKETIDYSTQDTIQLITQTSETNE